MAQAMSEERIELVVGTEIYDKIADMPTGHFWARTRTLNATPEEVIALSRNELAPERIFEIRTTTQLAFRELRDMPVPGISEWMTMQRARN